MKLKNPKILIPEEDPFKNDLLELSESAETLTELMKSLQDSFVLCINAPWGAGKTTFLKMWRQHLKNNKFSVLYFNAWENDFNDDALISLIGEITMGIDALQLEKGIKDKVLVHLKKAKKLGIALVKKSIPVVAKIATAGVLDLEKASEDALSELSEKIIEDQINKYESAKKTVETFRTELQRVAEEVAKQNPENPLPLIFIIDELDRCRPTFAIELIEKAKHFFNVSNIAFILAVDKDQIMHSIKSIYGQDMDVIGYLKRFIDLEYYFPSPKKGVFCKAMFHRFGLDEYFKGRTKGEIRYEYDHFQETFTELFSVLNFSLREQEQCFSQLSLAARITPQDNFLYPLVLCALIVIKAKNPSLYKDIITKKKEPVEILDYLKTSPGGNNFISSHEGLILEAELAVCTKSSCSLESIIASYKQRFNTGNAIEKKRAERIIEILDHIYKDRGLVDYLEYLIRKIEMTSKFISK